MKLACSLLLLIVFTLSAQEFVPNYDESLVPEYDLPDPLVFDDGRPVTSSQDWSERRKEILALFEEHVYGAVPGKKRARSRRPEADPRPIEEIRIFRLNKEELWTFCILHP